MCEHKTPNRTVEVELPSGHLVNLVSIATDNGPFIDIPSGNLT